MSHWGPYIVPAVVSLFVAALFTYWLPHRDKTIEFLRAEVKEMTMQIIALREENMILKARIRDLERSLKALLGPSEGSGSQ